jgi:hypothetical protein
MSGNAKLYGDVPSGVESPLKRLTAEQQETMGKLREIVSNWELETAEREFVTDMCLFRY